MSFCTHCGEPRKRYYGYSSRCQCGGPSGWIDHAFHVRIKGTRGEASVLTVSQSYNPNGEGLDSLKTALGFLYGGADRSWYYPGTTNLLVFGREEQLELVNLDYSTAGFSPPPPTRDNRQPTRWAVTAVLSASTQGAALTLVTFPSSVIPTHPFV